MLVCNGKSNGGKETPHSPFSYAVSSIAFFLFRGRGGGGRGLQKHMWISDCAAKEAGNLYFYWPELFITDLSLLTMMMPTTPLQKIYTSG